MKVFTKLLSDYYATRLICLDAGFLMINLVFSRKAGDHALSGEDVDFFNGNTDGTSVNTNKLDVKAAAFRIFPVNDASVGDPLPALRVEFFVCPPCGKQYF